MENFDPEMLLQPSEETIKSKRKILNNFLIRFGIKKSDSIIHFGCDFDGGDFINYLNTELPNIKYLGIDVNKKSIIELKSKYKKYKFEESSIQNKLDSMKKEYVDLGFREKIDWVIISDILNKNLYGVDQYFFVDSILRESLYPSDKGVIITFSTKHSEEDYSYGIGFLTSYLSSTYSRFDIIRVDETNYLMCIYKWFY